MAGMQPLKLSEVHAYLSMAGESCPDRRAKFLRLMLRMDNTYLEHLAKQKAA